MPDVQELDPRRLRALAHPMRIQLLSLLRKDGPATATLLAKRLGESSGATSYHLRQLAAYGFVEDDPERTTAGRERWWRAAQGVTRWRDSDFIYDPELRGSVQLLQHEVIRAHVQRAETWLAEQAEWDKSWVDAADLSDWTLRLTADQLARLRDELHEVLGRYQAAPAEPDAEQVIVYTHAFPRHQATAPEEPEADA
jgi:DNA-binding transcriptional ArsR family regulator